MLPSHIAFAILVELRYNKNSAGYSILPSLDALLFEICFLREQSICNVTLLERHIPS